MSLKKLKNYLIKQKNMLKKSLIIIWIITGLITIILSIHYWLYYYNFKDAWCLQSKDWCEPICQRFIQDCLERERAKLWYWWQIVLAEQLEKVKYKCPNICSLYTKSRWYFADEKEQEKYFKEKVEGCNKKLEEKQKEENNFLWYTSYCNKYWEIEQSLN